MTPYGLMQRASPYGHPHNVARGLTLAAVKAGVKRDAKGDTVLAQINPHEAAMLIAAGGSGRRDPRTGIIHFDPTGGSNAGGARHAGDGGSGGGTGGGGNNDGAGSGGGAYSGTHASGPGYGSGPSGSPSGGGGQYGRGDDGNAGLMGGASGAYNSTSQLGIRDPITSASLTNQGVYHSDSGPLGFLGRALLGLGYMDPTTMDRQALMSGQTPPGTPDTGFDAPGMALGIGGMFAGVPLGAAYLAGKTLFGAPKDFGMVDVGNWGNMGSGWGGSGASNVGSNVGSKNGQGNWGGRTSHPMSAAAMTAAWKQQQAKGWRPPGAAPPPVTPPAPPQPPALPPGVPPQQPFIPPGLNPYMPWRQFMAYQNPANLGALPFALPGQPGA